MYHRWDIRFAPSVCVFASVPRIGLDALPYIDRHRDRGARTPSWNRASWAWHVYVNEKEANNINRCLTVVIGVDDDRADDVNYHRLVRLTSQSKARLLGPKRSTRTGVWWLILNNYTAINAIIMRDITLSSGRTGLHTHALDLWLVPGFVPYQRCAHIIITIVCRQVCCCALSWCVIRLGLLSIALIASNNHRGAGRVIEMSMSHKTGGCKKPKANKQTLLHIIAER